MFHPFRHRSETVPKVEFTTSIYTNIIALILEISNKNLQIFINFAAILPINVMLLKIIIINNVMKKFREFKQFLFFTRNWNDCLTMKVQRFVIIDL
jgi:hypothetical protein